jgi:hypothetical protein
MKRGFRVDDHIGSAKLTCCPVSESNLDRLGTDEVSRDGAMLASTSDSGEPVKNQVFKVKYRFARKTGPTRSVPLRLSMELLGEIVSCSP